MEKQELVKALRRRVKSEREAASTGRVRFSAGLRRDVVSLLQSPDWGRAQLSEALELAPSLLFRWRKESRSAPAAGRLKKVRVVGEAVAPGGELELVFPSGAKVRGLTMAHLEKLVGGGL